MSERADQNRRVEIVELGEKRFVGVASTCSHQDVRGITVARGRSTISPPQLTMAEKLILQDPHLKQLPV